MLDCMKTENYFAEKKRMIKRAGIGVCRIKCEDCPLGITNNGMNVLCSELETLYPEKAIEIVQKWSDTHPQRTYLSVLLTHFPKIELSDAGIPKWICPHELGLDEIEDCGGTDICCAECWNQPIKNNEEGGENG